MSQANCFLAFLVFLLSTPSFGQSTATNICASRNLTDLARAVADGASPNSICQFGRPDPSRVSPYWVVLRQQAISSSVDWSAVDTVGVGLIQSGLVPGHVSNYFWGRDFRYESSLTNFELASRLRLVATVRAFVESGYVINPDTGSALMGELAFFRGINPVVRDGVIYPNPIPSDREYWRAFEMISTLMRAGVSPYRVKKAGVGVAEQRSVLYYMLLQGFPGDLLISVIDGWDFSKDPTTSDDFIAAAKASDRSDLVVQTLKKHLGL